MTNEHSRFLSTQPFPHNFEISFARYVAELSISTPCFVFALTPRYIGVSSMLFGYLEANVRLGITVPTTWGGPPTVLHRDSQGPCFEFVVERITPRYCVDAACVCFYALASLVFWATAPAFFYLIVVATPR